MSPAAAPKVTPASWPTQTGGINDVFAYKEIQLDSHQRDAGTNDEPVFYLAPAIHNVLAIKVVAAQIPFSYYVFDDHNNRFVLVDPSGTHDVALPTGNYDAIKLANTLMAVLNAASPTHGYFASYSAVNGKLTVTADADFALTFDTDPYASPHVWFGFTAGSNPSTNKTLVAPGVCLSTGPTYLLLTSSAGSRISNQLRINGTSSDNPPVLAKIPAKSNPWGLIDYQDPDATYFFDMSDAYLQQISLALQLGSSNRTLAMNGGPWSIVLSALCLRDTSITRYDVENQMAQLPRSSKRLRVG
jgi:hypothetical protein